MAGHAAESGGRDPGAPSQEPPGAAVAGRGMEEGVLWRRCRDGDASARSALVARYDRYAKAIAARLFARRPLDDVDFDDYHQYAMLGLLEAVDRFEPDRGARFTTFAMTRIKGAVLTGIERQTERRQQSAFRRRVLAERVSSFAPDDASLAEGEALLAELKKIGVGVALGLLLEGTGMVVQEDDALPTDAYAQVELRDVHRRLWGLVKELTPREREVFELHYREGRPFEEIGRTLGLSRGRISQLHRQAVDRLRTSMTASRGCDVTY